ncbi:hypothetical protein [Flavobacterium oreochromis]|uniref:Uncharacterized protein n=1 Tax=Flavobacterium columnare TaxID=996 RepID=A0A246GE23_9FLAO|nr:hypothetical protein [Flavobacterium oreochromis]OWP79659.1 hypothetical protein BWK62_00005 [Flavobacterium oreochromis]POR23155.1 hypothetical protein BWK58_10190 [Flavobacterium columnare]QYS87067.1 hypothetical protein JJC03_03610 [Flavobacterium oreochromis]
MKFYLIILTFTFQFLGAQTLDYVIFKKTKIIEKTILVEDFNNLFRVKNDTMIFVKNVKVISIKFESKYENEKIRYAWEMPTTIITIKYNYENEANIDFENIVNITKHPRGAILYFVKSGFFATLNKSNKEITLIKLNEPKGIIDKIEKFYKKNIQKFDSIMKFYGGQNLIKI